MRDRAYYYGQVMNRSRARNYCAIMLALFCGQVFALPFLDCCAGAGMVHEADMHAPEPGQPAMMHDHPAMNAPSHAASMPGPAENHECDHLCDFCLTPCSPVLTPGAELTLTQVPAIPIPAYAFSRHTTSQDNPFRPPIAA